MPTTINGIGTRYYGSSNVQVRLDVCQSCRRSSQLKSYDTRLWFVVVFIPVIPLGRKRILDYCPLCTRHHVVPLAQWEQIKQKNITEAMAGMQANPQDAKAAVKLHSALVAFGQTAEAAKVAQLMKDRFSRDAETLVYLGSSAQYYGRNAEAVPFFEQALQINPDLPEAKVAVALNLINQQRLDEARKLLQFLEAPGNTQAPGALFALAMGYQRTNRHNDALGLFTLLAERFPKLAKDRAFRKAFKKSEAAAGVRESKLPPRSINWKGLLAVGGSTVFLLLVLFGANYLAAQHRTLYVVSGLSKPAIVEIPGVGKVTVTSRHEVRMTVPEGDYQAVVTGATNQNINVKIHSTFWGRWFDKPAFIINVAGSSLLIVETVTYSANQTPGGGFTFRYSEPFLALAQVDYPFQQFPDSIDLPSHSSIVDKRRVSLFSHPTSQAFFALVNLKRLPEALQLAEWHLRLHPEDIELAPYYLYFGQLANRSAQVRAFFAEGVKRRPVEIEWHRSYQQASSGGRDANAAIAAEYDALLQADPENSSLLYLRARLYPGKQQATPLYERAIARDPSNCFAEFALGHIHAGSGDWPQAMQHLAAAARLQPTNSLFRAALFEARMGLRDYDSLETELRATLAKEPLDHLSLLEISEVFAAQNKTEAWEKLNAATRQQLQGSRGDTVEGWLTDLQAHYLYAAGQFDSLENLGVKKKLSRHPPRNFQALIELGRLSEAAELLNAQPAGQRDPFDVLALSVAWHAAGDESQSLATRNQAVALLGAGRSDFVAASELLQRTEAASPAEIMDVSITPQETALLLIAVAQKFPARAPEFLAAARPLNASRQFPYHLINRLTAPQTQHP